MDLMVNGCPDRHLEAAQRELLLAFSILMFLERIKPVLYLFFLERHIISLWKPTFQKLNQKVACHCNLKWYV